jgi:hypothetical protein
MKYPSFVWEKNLIARHEGGPVPGQMGDGKTLATVTVNASMIKNSPR